MSVHDYAGPADVRAMQQLAQDLWDSTSQWHVGALAHGRFQHLGREGDWPTRRWTSGGRTVAWGWIELPDHLSLQVHPEHPALAGEVLSWFAAATAPAARRSVTVLETDQALIDVLAAHSYRPAADDAPFFVKMSRGLTDLPTPVLPEGFRLRPLAGDAEAGARAAVHAAAFAPSRVTAASYRTVMAAWPYRHDLDWVVQAPDGRFAAYATLWLDPTHRVGLFEPVGTDPVSRRRGLARAVCLAGMHALAAAGATRVVVQPRGDDGYPVPARLYRSLGFQPGPRTRTYHLAG